MYCKKKEREKNLLSEFFYGQDEQMLSLFFMHYDKLEHCLEHALDNVPIKCYTQFIKRYQTMEPRFLIPGETGEDREED